MMEHPRSNLVDLLAESPQGLPRVDNRDGMPAVSEGAAVPLRDAVARMQAAPRCFSQKEWDALALYDGPIVSGDPDGRVPEDLETDDNE